MSKGRAFLFLAIASLIWGCSDSTDLPPPAEDQLPPWRPGYLDIHHISIDSDAAYLVFPDGTTMLFDAGESDKNEFERRWAPLKAAARRPDATRRAGELYGEYIRAVEPKISQGEIDYAVISHFHGDHYGSITKKSPNSKKGNYQLSGITDVAEQFDISHLFDRGFPSYDVPQAMTKLAERDRTFANYLKFLEARKANGKQDGRLDAGSADQIQLQHNPNKYSEFSVRNVKANMSIWTGKDSEVRELIDPNAIVDKNGRYNENPLSLAVLISYGDFDYFTGGDMTGGQGVGIPEWFDTETPLASVVGEVDAFALNHHGVRDANNPTFLAVLRPKTVIIQGRTSDHPGQEVAHSLVSKSILTDTPKIFSTYLHRETKIVYGAWFADAVVSEHGHVVIRVSPGGETYEIFILYDDRPGARIKARYGPFFSRN